MFDAFRHLFCLFQHDYRVTAERGTMFLLCRSCGHRTTGWQLNAAVGQGTIQTSITRATKRRPFVKALISDQSS
jgi:hypothetical protein